MHIVVVASKRRPPIITNHLAGIPHRVSYTPDYNLPDNFKPTFEAPNHIGPYRCFRGHQLALERATEDTLVLEDDALPNCPDWLDKVIAAKSQLDRYKVVCLHGRDVRPATIDEDGWLKPGFIGEHIWCLGTLAYWVNAKTAEQIVSKKFTGVPYDLFLYTNFSTCILEPSPFDHDRQHGSLVENPNGIRPTLSILICSLHRRSAYLRHLLSLLTPQLTPDVEVLTDIDDGFTSIGNKRNRLLRRAKNQYVVGIDDDDTVGPAYVSTLLDALKTEPDAVTFQVEHIFDGRFIRLERSGLHISPVKREIAQQVSFPEISVGEDRAWSGHVEPLLKTKVTLSKALYSYLHRSDKSEEYMEVKKIDSQADYQAALLMIEKLNHKPTLTPVEIEYYDKLLVAIMEHEAEHFK